MSLVFGGTTVNNIVFNGTTVDRIVFNGVEVYTSKPAKFMYWNGEYGQYTSHYSNRDEQHYFRNQIGWSGDNGPNGVRARAVYYNSDGIYFQDNPNPKPNQGGSRIELGFYRQNNDYTSNSPLIIKDLYVAIDNFVGNSIDAALWFHMYQESWDNITILDRIVEQHFNVSNNTILSIHLDYFEKNNFGQFRFYDNNAATFGTSYVIRRVWYDTY